MSSPATDIININYSDKKRDEILQELKSKDFDMLIIGGGITGAGVARDATMRGLNVALVEKDDFAEGTSSRSSKLFHGGLRYLKTFEIKLVEESTRERNWARDVAMPHNVRPLHFIVPVYDERTDPRTGKTLPASSMNLELIRAALKLYDEACKNQNYGSWDVIEDPKKLAEIEPELTHDQLLGIGMYYDTNMDDARYTVETIKECVASGTCTAINYLKVIDFTHDDRGLVNGVKVIQNDKFSIDQKQDPFVIRANIVVNCTGIWADKVLGNKNESKIIKPSKGIHFTVKKEHLDINHAFGISSIDDHRFFFVIPRENWILIGTTDTFYKEDLDSPVTIKEEVDYLRNTVEYLFPNAKIDDSHILGTYAGIRPLVIEPGKSAGDISRKHLFLERDDGLFSLLGGKFTTYRKMAEDLIRRGIMRSKKVDITRNGTLNIPKDQDITKKPYKIALKRDEFEQSKQYRGVKDTLDEFILDHLFIEFGKGALTIIDTILEEPNLGQQLIQDPEYPSKYFPWIKAEINYIVKHEIPRHLNDVLCRRTEICWLVHPSRQRKIAEVTTEIMGKILGWNDTRKIQEIEFYLNYVKANSYFFKKEL